MDDDSASLGLGYDFASATVTGNAELRPIIGPRDGIGKSSIADLKSSSIMFNIRPDGTEGGTFNTNNDFRQISLLKGLEQTDSAGGDGPLYTGVSANVNRHMTVTSTSEAASFVADEIITGATSGVTAYVDEIDSDIIYFHQNSNNIAGAFTDGEAISGSATGSATIDSGDKYSIVDVHSGDLLYIENRARVIRSASQIEDIKIVITV